MSLKDDLDMIRTRPRPRFDRRKAGDATGPAAGGRTLDGADGRPPRGRAAGSLPLRGTIEFETAGAAARALEVLNGTDLNGKPLVLLQEDLDKEAAHLGANYKPKRLIVSNLKIKRDQSVEEVLKELFKPVGTVVSVRPLPGRSRSFATAVVEFGTAVEAAEALRSMQGAPVLWQKIRLRMDERDAMVGRLRRIVAKGLPGNTTKAMLEERFQECGRVVSSTITREWQPVD